jgi:hypothetical protein
MVSSCSAYGCENRQGIGDTHSYHKFPANSELRKKWFASIKRKYFVPGIGAVICSDHFLATDYKTNTDRRELVCSAVPSVFHGFPDHLQPPPKSPRRILVRPELPDAFPDAVCSQDNKVIEDAEESEASRGRQLHRVPQKAGDHNYCYSSDIDNLKESCDMYRALLTKKDANESRLRNKFCREKKSRMKVEDCLEKLRLEKVLSNDGFSFLQERFSDVQLEVVKDVLRKKGDKRHYSTETKDFAVALHFYSPKAVKFLKFLSSMFTLPSASTIRRLLGSVDCYPGFQLPAFQELKSHMGDITYSDGALSVDGMSMKQMIQYDARLGRCLGYVDMGGVSDLGDSDVLANEALVVMVVGLRKYWKISIRDLSAASAVKFNITPVRWQHPSHVAIVPTESKGRTEGNNWDTAYGNFKT